MKETQQAKEVKEVNQAVVGGLARCREGEETISYLFTQKKNKIIEI